MGGFSKQASDKQSIKAADTACSNNAVRGRRRSEQASGKQSLSAVPPTIYHSGVLSRKQAVSIRPVPQASQNNSIRSLSLRDLAFLRAAFSRRRRATFRTRSLFFGPAVSYLSEPLFAVHFMRSLFFGPAAFSRFVRHAAFPSREALFRGSSGV